MADRTMESALRDLGRGSIGRLPSTSSPAPARGARPRSWRPRVLWMAAARRVGVGHLPRPAARQAVANLLDVAGIRIEFGNAPRPVPTVEIPLGELVDLEVGPERSRLPDPEFHRSLRSPARFTCCTGGSVHRFSSPGERRSVARGGRQRHRECLLAEFRADLDEPFFAKIVQQGTTVDRVTVNGTQAFWLAGAPHVFMFETGGRDLVEDATRLTGNVLIWEAEGITYRLESNLGLEDSLAHRRVAEPVGFSAAHSGTGSAAPPRKPPPLIPTRRLEFGLRGCSSKAELQPSKLVVRVRFPSPAPK